MKCTQVSALAKTGSQWWGQENARLQRASDNKESLVCSGMPGAVWLSALASLFQGFDCRGGPV